MPDIVSLSLIEKPLRSLRLCGELTCANIDTSNPKLEAKHERDA